MVTIDLTYEGDREILERVPETCPVTKSLHPDTEVSFRFHWPQS